MKHLDFNIFGLIFLGTAIGGLNSILYGKPTWPAVASMFVAYIVCMCIDAHGRSGGDDDGIPPK